MTVCEMVHNIYNMATLSKLRETLLDLAHCKF